MIAFLLALVILPSAGASTPADLALALRQGTPASWDEATRASAVGRLEAGLRGLSIHLAARRETSDARCARFHKNLDETIRQLMPLLATSPRAFDVDSAEPEFWDALRLRLLQSAFFGLTRAFRDGADGGYDSLDAKEKIACPVYRRPAMAESMDEIAHGLAEYMREGLGGPGLDKWDLIGWRLLAYGKRAESKRVRRDWYITGGTVAASLLAWRYAPKAIERLAGQALPWLYMKRVQAVALPLVYGAEGLAVYHTLAWLNPEERKALEDGVGSWSDMMTEIEALLTSPKEAPELGYRYVSSVKAMLAKAFRVRIEDEPTVARADEALALAGLAPGAAAAILRERLLADHGMHVECTLSEFRCLRGLQNLARLIYDERLKTFEPGEDQTLKFAIRREPGITYESDVEAMTILMPANANVDELVSIVDVVRTSAAFAQRVGQARAYARDLARLQRMIVPSVEFESGLTRHERWRATLELTGLAQARPELFRRHADVLRVGRQSHAPFEENMRLVEIVPADELERALNDRWAEPLQQGWLRERKESEKLANEVQALTDFPIRCRHDGALKVRDCLSTLRAWLVLARTNAPVTQQAVDIFDRRVLGSDWDMREGRLAISPGFDPGQLPLSR